MSLNQLTELAVNNTLKDAVVVRVECSGGILAVYLRVSVAFYVRLVSDGGDYIIAYRVTKEDALK